MSRFVDGFVALDEDRIAFLLELNCGFVPEGQSALADRIQLVVARAPLADIKLDDARLARVDDHGFADRIKFAARVLLAGDGDIDVDMLGGVVQRGTDVVVRVGSQLGGREDGVGRRGVGPAR